MSLKFSIVIIIYVINIYVKQKLPALHAYYAGSHFMRIVPKIFEPPTFLKLNFQNFIALLQLLFPAANPPQSSLPPRHSRFLIEEHSHRRKEQSRAEEILGMNTVVAGIGRGILLPK